MKHKIVTYLNNYVLDIYQYDDRNGKHPITYFKEHIYDEYYMDDSPIEVMYFQDGKWNWFNVFAQEFLDFYIANS